MKLFAMVMDGKQFLTGFLDFSVNIKANNSFPLFSCQEMCTEIKIVRTL